MKSSVNQMKHSIAENFKEGKRDLSNDFSGVKHVAKDSYSLAKTTVSQYAFALARFFGVEEHLVCIHFL
jgi:hypothetical protein